MRHGFLLVDKPCGPTSHDVVYGVRRALSERSVGHLGTLDPAASGLLVLAVGAKALKVVELFGSLPKTYEAVVKLGAVSSTYDREGIIEDVTRKPGVDLPETETVLRTIRERFLGRVTQVPPQHSAVHVGGERAYEAARAGRTVVMPERTVTIEACDVLSYEYPLLRLRVRCGSGTYIRSLAHDLGTQLRCGGYLQELRRTAVGQWKVEDATEPDRVAWAKVMPMKDVLAGLPARPLTDDEFAAIKVGRDVPGPIEGETVAWHNDLPVALLTPLGPLAHPRKVF